MFSRLLIVLSLFMLFDVQMAMGESRQATNDDTYYLSPDGEDNNAGTRQQPWKTLQKASQSARAGDAIILLPGVYEGVLAPRHSGQSDSPITFRADKRRTARLVGTKQGGHIVNINGRSHIEIEGLHVQPKWPKSSRWLSVADSSHVTVTDCLMEKAAGNSALKNTPCVIYDSDQIQIRDCVLREFIGGDMTHVFNSNHILFEGNAIGKAGHSPLALSPRIELFKGLKNVVLRGNVFFAGWGRPFEIFSEPNVLFEDNLIINAFNGARSAGPEAKVMTENGIVRYNRVFRNWGAPVNLGYYHPDAKASSTRYYNNVIDDNPQRAIRIETVKGYLFKNNIFSRNDLEGGHRQVVFRGDASRFQMKGNAFWADGAPVMLEDLAGSGVTLTQAQTEQWRKSRGEQFAENIEVDPRYRDAVNYDHALSAESPLLDAGQHLTSTRESGQGKSIPVEDVQYFFDGFGVDGEVGDIIAIGSAAQIAQIVKVDRQKRMLELDRSVRFQKNDPVSFPWAGSAPDIGVYEHGTTGRGSVQVVVEPFAARPGEPVQIRAVAHGGLEPVSYHWQLGDGTIATTAELTHRYEQVQGYPLRVRATDKQGRVYRGTGFVDVQDPDKLKQPLLHTSFNNDPGSDEPDFETDAGNWYQVYYKSRPTVKAEIVRLAGDNQAIHFWANSDNHLLAITAYPENWRVDQYPLLKIRYRVDKGVPLGLSIEAFSDIKQDRKVYVALAPNARPASHERLNQVQTLHNDGKWHEMTIDTRSIRELYPDVQTLQRLRFEAVDPARIQEGDSFWLDDLIILPEGGQAASVSQTKGF